MLICHTAPACALPVGLVPNQIWDQFERLHAYAVSGASFTTIRISDGEYTNYPTWTAGLEPLIIMTHGLDRMR